MYIERKKGTAMQFLSVKTIPRILSVLVLFT
ncbi:hypothetical protein FX981_01843 [Bacillus safensis]|uniref:Uncharacterized protein n=1 Tax=Bacillus safensis TaxID=561879 RepID=A0A5C0WGG4_BACIA|nr:hypothetical protein FX981_01843 [Bacillus safensis]